MHTTYLVKTLKHLPFNYNAIVELEQIEYSRAHRLFVRIHRLTLTTPVEMKDEDLDPKYFECMKADLINDPAYEDVITDIENRIRENVEESYSTKVLTL